VTVFFGNCRYGSVGGRQKKIDRLIPIVAETEQIVDRRNWYLKSRAQISDGSARRFFVVRRKIALLNQRVTIALNHRVGATGALRRIT
jgi:hypothetical protein